MKITGKYRTCSDCKYYTRVLDEKKQWQIVGGVCTYPLMKRYFIKKSPNNCCECYEVAE